MNTFILHSIQLSLNYEYTEDSFEIGLLDDIEYSDKNEILY